MNRKKEKAVKQKVESQNTFVCVAGGKKCCFENLACFVFL